MAITGIIFQQKKVVFETPKKFLNEDGSKQTPLQNIAGVLQGNLFGQTTGIVIDATMTESHVLTSEVTQYPIEDGSVITDHVQLKPLIYQMTGCISDTPIGFLVLGNIGNILNTVQKLLGSGRAQESYYAIVDLWKSRLPFTVTTNLKRYENMIFTSFVVDDDVDTANEINFKATLQQVTITQSQTIQGQNLDQRPRVKETAQSTVNNGTNTTDPIDRGSTLNRTADGLEDTIDRFKIP